MGGGGLAFPFKLKKMLLLFIHRKQELRDREQWDRRTLGTGRDAVHKAELGRKEKYKYTKEKGKCG